MISPIGTETGSLLQSAEQPGSLGREAFLNLLVTQLKNQNPLEPMDGTEFVTQLAQFSELEEVRNVSSGMDMLKNLNAGDRVTITIERNGQPTQLNVDASKIVADIANQAQQPAAGTPDPSD